VTSFMPPPPPPRITRRVIAESGECGLDPEAAFFHIVTRWYRKVEVAQCDWVSADDLCPVPDETVYTFDQWVDEIGKWWLRHFEHVQIKTTASSGLLRTASHAAAAQNPQQSSSSSIPMTAAGAGAATGVRRAFESHTTTTTTPSRHMMPLPRKVIGSSGLTAELLESHNMLLPAPRSAQAPRRELPW